MSVEEDTELRNLVAQTLENKGILPKIRAELRANVFLALEENVSTRETLLKNEELSSFIQIPLGILILNLVREFLEFFGLDFTLSVFDPETKYGKDYNNISREKMMKELNIAECKRKGPLLYEIISKVVNDIKEESKNNVRNDKNVVAVNLNHCDTTLNGDDEIVSPSNFNTTYVKYQPDGNGTPVNETHSNGDNENNGSIEEECISNKLSTSENSSKEIELKTTDQLQNVPSLPQGISDELNSFKPIPDNTSEFDLLTFTPVKEAKVKERIIHREVPKNDFQTKDKINNLSVLGDLPPLNAKTEAKRSKMNEIKAIINQGLNLDNYDDDDFHSTISSKTSTDEREDSDKYAVQNSDRSQNADNASDKTDKTDIIEEENLDISDLINHDSTENQLTMDETVSKLSDVADYLESL